ncbi:MAG: hypothetical protein B6244_09390 [Candidatus Cloacimonetes bacterium 4572_55]|nr:MAG: hypothetical protein B6244_09390 [Candidatus Cloacimonetes bacterium 4572_55]
MAQVTRKDVLEKLSNVKYPGYSRDIISLGVVKSIKISDGYVAFRLELTTENSTIPEKIIAESRSILLSIEGVKDVAIEIVKPKGKQHNFKPPEIKNYLPDVKCKIAVASGKGGVGKSTVAVNLALGLARTGAKVGLYDVDIYGPSMPIMLGIEEPPFTDGEKVYPHEKYGIQLMSIGFLVDKSQALIWRGPMVMKAVEQLLSDVAWEEDLDFLVFDLPPGTGDAHLSLSQLTNLSGAVIVTTPQTVALADAIKSVNMFKKVNVPIYGIVENMSYFLCPHCQEKSYIFDHGGAEKAAKQMDVPFLGEIPIHTSIRESCDKGIPIVSANPESPEALSFVEIAKKIMASQPK